MANAQRHWRQLQERIGRGQFDAALLAADKFIAAEPNNPDGHYWRGYCYMRLNKPQQAESALRLAIDICSDHPESLSLLGRCLVVQEKHREAIEAARQAENTESQNPEVWDALGVVYSQVKEYADAARVFRKVKIQRPESARNLFNLATALNFCHETKDAELNFHEALKLDPKMFLAYFSLSQMKTHTVSDNNIDFLRDKLNIYKNEPDARLHINLSLAKELEDIGEYEASFQHLKAGMNCQRESIHYQLDQDRRLIDTIKKTFDNNFCQSDSSLQNSEPIFILGMPRTGSTLLEQIIAAHSDVFAAGELHNFYNSWVDQSKPNLDEPTPSSTMAYGRRLDFEKLGEDYITSTRPRTGHTKHFIDKKPNNYLYLGAIFKSLPQAKVIHMVRDPMDTCYANYKLLFGRSTYYYSYTQEEMAGYYLLYRDLMAHWEQCFPGRFLTVHYEDLVADTETEARRIIDNLNLDWQPQCLNFQELKQPVGTASNAQVRQPIYTSSIHKWRHYSRQLTAMCEILEHVSHDRLKTPDAF